MLRGVRREFMEHHRECACGAFAHTHPGDCHANVPAKRAVIIIGSDQNTHEIAQQSSLALRTWKGPNEIMCAIQCGQTARKSFGHMLDRLARPRREPREARSDGQEFLTRWLISPASNSLPSSACLRPVTSRNIPNMMRSPIPASPPCPLAEIHRI